MVGCLLSRALAGEFERGGMRDGGCPAAGLLKGFWGVWFVVCTLLDVRGFFCQGAFVMKSIPFFRI